MVIHLLNQKIAMNVADSVINSVFISLYDQMIKQDDKHGFIKHSNEKHSTIFINSPELMQHGTG